MAGDPARVALVTGSTRGLGRAMAVRLARDGRRVAVNGRPGDTAGLDVVEAIRSDGDVAEAFRADVTDEQQVREMVDDIQRAFGPVEVLVANATGPQPRTQ